MTIPLKSLKTLGIFTIALICTIVIMSVPVSAQIPSIVVKVADTTAFPGAINTPISVFMDNVWDDVAGFNLWIQLDRPDIMIFQTDTVTVYDTTFWDCLDSSGSVCIDSVEVFSWEEYDFFYDTVFLDTIGNFDTTGTLASGWEFLDTRSLSGIGTDINIVGIADMPGGSSIPPIPAGQQGGVLLRVLADIYDLEDTLTDRTVNMIIQTDFRDHFGFSRPDGTSITWVSTEIMDTTCWVCTQWVGEICLNWIQALLPYDQCDSLEIALDTVAVLDTANVVINDGSVTVLLSYICGNMDGSEPPFPENPISAIDIADLVYMVQYMFSQPPGPAPNPISVADVDCSTEVDIADLVYMVAFMFSQPPGPVPCAACQ